MPSLACPCPAIPHLAKRSLACPAMPRLAPPRLACRCQSCHANRGRNGPGRALRSLRSRTAPYHVEHRLAVPATPRRAWPYLAQGRAATRSLPCLPFLAMRGESSPCLPCHAGPSHATPVRTVTGPAPPRRTVRSLPCPTTRGLAATLPAPSCRCRAVRRLPRHAPSFHAVPEHAARRLPCPARRRRVEPCAALPAMRRVAQPGAARCSHASAVHPRPRLRATRA